MVVSATVWSRGSARTRRVSRMTRFWATALGYQIEPPPEGFAAWNDYYRSIGVAEDGLDAEGDGSDSLLDPTARGPRIWFQVVPGKKTVKNRIHFDLGVSGGRSVPLETCKARVDAEVDRLVGVEASRLRVVPAEGVNHYGVVSQDPEGTSSACTDGSTIRTAPRIDWVLRRPIEPAMVTQSMTTPPRR